MKQGKKQRKKRMIEGHRRESHHLPLFVDMRGKPCLVLGGGKVALRKVRRLLEAGAKVEVMSPEVCGGIEKLVKVGNVTIKRPRNKTKNIGSYINRFFLVLLCTDDPEYNRHVGQACRKAGILVNSATEPEEGDVFFGAESGTKNIRFAVSTGGRSPLAARWFARWVARMIPREADDFIENLYKLRVSGARMGEIGPKAWLKVGGLDWVEEIEKDGGREIVETIETMNEESDKKREEKE